MSHNTVLAYRTPRGWSGVHIQWGLPGWVLPALHQRIRGYTGGSGDLADLREGMHALIEADIRCARSGYDRYPENRNFRGDGRVGARSTRWGLRHETLYVLDPDAGTVEVSVFGRCPTHQPAIEEAAARHQLERQTTRRQGLLLTCPWGVRDRSTTQGGVRHPYHRLPGCGCLCAGWTTSKTLPVLTYRIDDRRVPRLLATFDGSSTRKAMQQMAKLLKAPDGAAELYTAMREQGAAAEVAAEAAGLVFTAAGDPERAADLALR